MNTLIDEIIYCKDWRVRELEQLKKLKVTVFYSVNEKVKEQYFRMCLPYIYAHWEGFVVETFKLVIGYINKKELSKNQVINQLFTFSQRNAFKTLSGKQSFKQSCDFSKTFTENLEKPVYIETSLFTTKSNLNYSQLEEIFSWFDLSTYTISTYKADLNRLVNLRNQIVHGENSIYIEYKSIEKYINIINELYDKIIILTHDYIKNEQYININMCK